MGLQSRWVFASIKTFKSGNAMLAKGGFEAYISMLSMGILPLMVAVLGGGVLRYVHNSQNKVNKKNARARLRASKSSSATVVNMRRYKQTSEVDDRAINMQGMLAAHDQHSQQDGSTNTQSTGLEDDILSEKNGPSQNSSDKVKEKKPGVIVLHVLAKQGVVFQGYALLTALEKNHLYCSEQKHFQRYSKENGKGDVWFHLASMHHPGTFALDEPGALRCEGLVLICDCSKVEHIIHAYDCMLETANQLAQVLDGEVCDQQRQPLTQATITQHQQLVAAHALQAEPS